MAAILAFAAATAVLTAGPSRFGFSDRIERHLFPEVTTGPAEPSWSPDGKSIAFSWRSDAERDAFKREIDQARAVYMKLSGS